MNIAQRFFNNILLSHTLTHPFFSLEQIDKALSESDRGIFNPDVNAVEIVRDVADRYSLDKMRKRLKYSFEELTDLYIKDYLKKRHAEAPFNAKAEDLDNSGLSPKEIQDKRVDAKELVELAVQFDTLDEEIASIIIDSGIHLGVCLFGERLLHEFADFLCESGANLSDEAFSMLMDEYVREISSDNLQKEHYAFRGLQRFARYLIHSKPHLLPNFIGTLEATIESPVNDKQQYNLLLTLSELILRSASQHQELMEYVQAIIDSNHQTEV